MAESIEVLDYASTLQVTGGTGDVESLGVGLAWGIAFAAGFFGSGGLLGVAVLAGAAVVAYDMASQ